MTKKRDEHKFSKAAVLEWMVQNEIEWVKMATTKGPRYNVFDCRNKHVVRFIATCRTFNEMVEWVRENRFDIFLESQPNTTEVRVT